jgi:excisionase family DNA binding protein
MTLSILDDLLTIPEAAALLHVSEHCIRAWFTRGVKPLPRVKCGSRTLVRRSDLEDRLTVSTAPARNEQQVSI